MLTILIFAAFLIITFAARVVAIKIGARIARSDRATFLRAILAALVMFAAGILLQFTTNFIQGPPLVAAIALMIAGVFIEMLIIANIFKLTFPRAALAWTPSLVYTILFLCGFFFLIRPYVSESFRVPNAGMAPSIISEHHTATCPQCSGSLLVPVPNEREIAIRGKAAVPTYGVCSNCFQSSPIEFSKIPHDTTSDDRIMVLKFLQPERFDIIAFKTQYGDIWIKRLIALPGEIVHLEANQILVDGKPLPLSAELSKIKWSALPEITREAEFATTSQPLTLASDEYFVLGDDLVHSSDSRFTGPIKKSQLVGVVTITYFPFSRFRIFR